MGRKSNMTLLPHRVEPPCFHKAPFSSFYDPGWLRHFMTASPSPDSILLRSLRYSDLPFSHANSRWTLLGQSVTFCSRTLSHFLLCLLALPPPFAHPDPQRFTPPSTLINLLTRLLSITLWVSFSATKLHSHINMYAPSFVNLLRLPLFSLSPSVILLFATLQSDSTFPISWSFGVSCFTYASRTTVYL